jgi:hypothetical protein
MWPNYDYIPSAITTLVFDRGPSRVARSRGRETGAPEGKHSQTRACGFNIKGNDFRLVAVLDYPSGVVRIRFFGTHAEYDAIDAETV